jgi:hypothetical protein
MQPGRVGMAKKKNKVSVPRTEKARMELRVDQEAYVQIRELAEAAGVTVNQVVNGLVHWAASHGHVGEAIRDEEGLIETKPMEGKLWFGTEGAYLSQDRIDYYESKGFFDYENPVPGVYSLGLDFTEARVVKEGL